MCLGCASKPLEIGDTIVHVIMPLEAFSYKAYLNCSLLPQNYHQVSFNNMSEYCLTLGCHSHLKLY